MRWKPAPLNRMPSVAPRTAFATIGTWWSGWDAAILLPLCQAPAPATATSLLLPEMASTADASDHLRLLYQPAAMPISSPDQRNGIVITRDHHEWLARVRSGATGR